MELNLKGNVKDVEISTGQRLHWSNKVFLKFRRPVDTEIASGILGLSSRYGWNVMDFRNDPNGMGLKGINYNADFLIECTGADSCAVANAIAENLTVEHGLTIQKIQRLTYAPNYSRTYYVRDFHDPNYVGSEDVPI